MISGGISWTLFARHRAYGLGILDNGDKGTGRINFATMSNRFEWLPVPKRAYEKLPRLF